MLGSVRIGVEPPPPFVAGLGISARHRFGRGRFFFFGRSLCLDIILPHFLRLPPDRRRAASILAASRSRRPVLDARPEAFLFLAQS